jgi:hypothetical protein
MLLTLRARSNARRKRPMDRRAWTFTLGMVKHLHFLQEHTKKKHKKKRRNASPLFSDDLDAFLSRVGSGEIRWVRLQPPKDFSREWKFVEALLLPLQGRVCRR